jgi:hypothetical protein
MKDTITGASPSPEHGNNIVSKRLICSREERRERVRATLTGLVHVFLVAPRPQLLMLFYQFYFI